MKRSQLELTFSRQIRFAGLPEAVAEFKFHEARRWRADFAWPDKMVIAEIEGGTRSGGRHVRGDGFEQDCEKYNAAALLGWRVFRFTGDMVASGAALATMEQALK
jgi:very-short-patch-repair endonuclease